MGWIDFILNFTGVLLWLGWRSRRFDPLVRTSAASLAGTLRPAEKHRFKGLASLAGLVALLVVRAFLYWQIGSPAMWNPKLHLYFVVISFRCDDFPSALVFSLVSFVRIFLLFYAWLLALCIVDRGFSEADPLQRLLRLHLGRLARWHWLARAMCLPVAVLVCWVALHPLLVYIGVLSPARSPIAIVLQGLLLSVSLLLSLKYLFPLFLFLHFLNSYVYFGNNPMWDFISVTARNLTAPLRSLPLRIGRLDLAPLTGIVLWLVLLEIIPRAILQYLHQHNYAWWPQ